MPVPWIDPAFVAGEVAPNLYGRIDLSKLHTAASTMRNSFVSYRGGSYSRAGTGFVARAKQPYAGLPPRVIPFKFSISQSFCLEFGDHYMRVHSNGAPVIETPFAITAASQANPCQITAPGHNYANGDWVTISGALGMGELNGNTYLVANANIGAGTFTLQDLNGNQIDSTAYGAYAGGGQVSRIYTLTTPYAIADVSTASDHALIKWAQSADVMSLVHPSYQPIDLARISDTNWVISPISVGASIAAPASCSVTATTQPSGATTPPTLPAAYAFCVTAVDAITGEESIASPIGNCTNSVDIAETAGSLIIDWAAVAGAGSYNIYKAPTSYNTNPGNPNNALPVPDGAPFGYIGTAFGTEFVDSNITPDFQQVPPLHRNPFAPGQIVAITITAPGSGYASPAVSITSATGSGFVGQAVVVGGQILAVIVQNAGSSYQPGDTVHFTGGHSTAASATASIGPQSGTYPGVVSYFQERRIYANSFNNPNTYWMSQPGAFLNFDSGIPVSDSDAITGTPWAQQVNGIQAMVMMSVGLVVMTGLGAWQVTGSGASALNPQAITPSNQQAQPQAFNGCHEHLWPIQINYDILYVQAKGSIVRDLNYNFWVNIYTGSDLTQLSGHLFDGFQILDWAWCEEPYKIVWAVRNDNALLSLTYLKEQEVTGWARHDTFGQFWSVCSVTEPPVDALYLVTARFPSDGAHYYIERMDNRVWKSIEDCWCVDCGLRLPLGTPDAQLAVSGPSGSQVFTTSPGVFSPSHVGQVIRVGGGIATVTSYTSSTSVVGTFNKPATQITPNNPGSSSIIANPGKWTITAQQTTVGGLGHLVGLTVTGLADGVVIPPTVVPANGRITLPQASSSVIVGLPFTAQLQTVYAEPGSQPTVQGRRKDITAAVVRIEASRGLAAGSNQPDGAVQSPPVLQTTPWAVTPIKNQGTTYTSPGGAVVTELFTGDERVPLFATWRRPGQLAIQQTQPLPMQILAIVPEALEGDLPEAGYTDATGPSRDTRGAARSARGPR